MATILNQILGGKKKIVIQPVRMGDLSALSDIHTKSFNRGWSDGEFEALLAQESYFCLVSRNTGEADKPPSGFVLIKKVLDEAEVISIATNPNLRRKGIARHLMDEATRQLQSDRIKSLFLEVDNQNEAAISLYKDLGFKEIGSRSGYYPDSSQSSTKPSAALVMRLELG